MINCLTLLKGTALAYQHVSGTGGTWEGASCDRLAEDGDDTGSTHLLEEPGRFFFSFFLISSIRRKTI